MGNNCAALNRLGLTLWRSVPPYRDLAVWCGAVVASSSENGDSGAWNPQFGELEVRDSGGWVVRNASFVVPTTARTVDIHLAFGAHTFTYSPDRMLGGRAPLRDMDNESDDEVEFDDFGYVDGVGQKLSLLKDTIKLSSRETREKLAISFALAQSAKLGV